MVSFLVSSSGRKNDAARDTLASRIAWGSALNEIGKNLRRTGGPGKADRGHLLVGCRAETVERRPLSSAGVTERLKAAVDRTKAGSHGSIPYSIPPVSAYCAATFHFAMRHNAPLICANRMAFFILCS
ncbi:hypothetical protein PWG15_03690 [Ensifer adhaerens]|uniref:hypothetical protein n=1 Tax=Ensifer adhaerens TaxID=106592 RepID=UPI0023AA099F|nr:hypothetical protein [Ensifer adhaerens]WDZ79035.1 hypothetical protein PWG15_03690 [Ensifer adhaerens]